MKKKIFIGLVMLASTISNFTFAQNIYKTVANVPLVQLNNGILMPQLGLGTFLQPSDSVCEQSCLTALKAGYRHIDTAHAYNDEAGVGRAVKESGIPRKDIWITSKLWPTEYGEGKTLKAIDEMLKRMQLYYIDLLYVHQPIGDFVGAWRDMEKAVAMGKVRALGISNFDASDKVFNKIMNESKVKPAVLQIECHPYAQRLAIREKVKTLWHTYYMLIPFRGCNEQRCAVESPNNYEYCQSIRKNSGTSYSPMAYPRRFFCYTGRIKSRLHQRKYKDFRF